MAKATKVTFGKFEGATEHRSDDREALVFVNGVCEGSIVADVVNIGGAWAYEEFRVGSYTVRVGGDNQTKTFDVLDLAPRVVGVFTYRKKGDVRTPAQAKRLAREWIAKQFATKEG